MRYEKQPGTQSAEQRRKVVADFPSGMVLSVCLDGFDIAEDEPPAPEPPKPPGEPPREQ